MVSVLKFKRVINAFVKRRDNSNPIEKLSLKKNIPIEYYKSLKELQERIAQIKEKLKSVNGSNESEVYKKEIDALRMQINLIKEDIERLGRR